MKKFLIVLSIVAGLSACSVNTSKIEDFDTDDITYVKDHKTGLCFAVTASRKTGDMSSSGMGVACVPCEKVEAYLEK